MDENKLRQYLFSVYYESLSFYKNFSKEKKWKDWIKEPVPDKKWLLINRLAELKAERRRLKNPPKDLQKLINKYNKKRKWFRDNE